MANHTSLPESKQLSNSYFIKLSKSNIVLKQVKNYWADDEYCITAQANHVFQFFLFAVEFS